eukprot:TRINITY_DN5478_c0_g1_i2.p1 TRINITY_DN5478_c0_g1~~TRINITY_DN5478_c0_g1_i2.p1  ORF type:complete len:443 (+),score=96.95 TRINITY_DN5478_c0_g1_i2:56-1330(+)
MDRKRILAFSRAPTSVKRGKTIAATASDDRFDDLSNLRVTGICCAVAECVMDRKRILAFSRAPTSVKRGKTIAATASDDRFDDLSNLRVIDRSISGTELHAKLQHCSSFALKQLPDVVSSVAIRQTNKLDEDWVISACVCSTRQIDLKKSTGEVSTLVHITDLRSKQTRVSVLCCGSASRDARQYTAGDVVAFINPTVFPAYEGAGRCLLRIGDGKNLIRIGKANDYGVCSSAGCTEAVHIRKDVLCAQHADAQLKACSRRSDVCGAYLPPRTDRQSASRNQQPNILTCGSFSLSGGRNLEIRLDGKFSLNIQPTRSKRSTVTTADGANGDDAVDPLARVVEVMHGRSANTSRGNALLQSLLDEKALVIRRLADAETAALELEAAKNAPPRADADEELFTEQQQDEKSRNKRIAKPQWAVPWKT